MDARKHWLLPENVDYLTHGSFGAAPIPVLEEQVRWRALIETNPSDFFGRRLEEYISSARDELAHFVGSHPENLVFVPNATTGVNAVLRSLELKEGDELLTTDHEYNACRNALEFVASRWGARIVVVPIPFPIDAADTVADLVLGAITPRTRLFLIDHVSSSTALVMPVERIVAEAEAKGVRVLIDGAHGPGMLDLDLEALGASYYTGNCHKWICSPKGAALLHARPDRQDELAPLSISHGWNDPRLGRPRFHKLFDWTGTEDPSAILSVPEAIRFMGSLLPGGWPELRRSNHDLVLAGRDVICETLGIEPPAPDDMLGSMAAIPLPDGKGLQPQSVVDAATERLNMAGFEVPVFIWPAWPRRMLRISAQAYNDIDQYQRLAVALAKEIS